MSIQKNKKTVIFTSIIISIIGLVIVFIKLYITSDKNTQDFKSIVYSLLELIGLTVFTSGVFTVLLQTKDWTQYFEERLTSLVMNQDYLNNLSNDELLALQVKTIKAYYKNDSLDKEGSFLNYFQENLSNFIKEPYRDSVKSEIIIEKVESDGIWVYDHLTYHCRMVGNSIQDSVKWITGKDEYSDLLQLNITISYEDKNICLLNVYKENEQYIIKYEDKEENKTFDSIFDNGFILDLSKHNIDNLLVTIESRYKIVTGNFSTWVMAHPTKGLYFTIRYPEELDINFQTMLLHPKSVIKNSQKGFYSMQYDEWLLPNSGIVYSFSKK